MQSEAPGDPKQQEFSGGSSRLHDRRADESQTELDRLSKRVLDTSNGVRPCADTTAMVTLVKQASAGDEEEQPRYL